MENIYKILKNNFIYILLIIGSVATFFVIYEINWLHDHNNYNNIFLRLLLFLFFGIIFGAIYLSFVVFIIKRIVLFKEKIFKILSIFHLPFYILLLYPMHIKFEVFGEINRFLMHIIFLFLFLLIASFMIIKSILLKKNNNYPNYDKIIIKIDKISNDKLLVSFLLFFLALFVRLIFYYKHSHLTSTGFSIFGIPFNDAWLWDQVAENISKGNGINYGDPLSYRPFYSIFLSFFYTWCGTSVEVAKFLNIISNSITIVVIYLIGEKCFNKFVGFFSALIIIFDNLLLKFNLLSMTEVVGLLFFVLSIYFLIIAIENIDYFYFFTAGLFFILLNLTRTLTWLCFPIYLILIFYFFYKNNITKKKIIISLFLFILGIMIALCPWLIRQKIIIGVPIMSSNTAEGFYCAVNPKYGYWKYEINQEMKEKGIDNIKDRINYCKIETIKNLIKYPNFTRKNLTSSFLYSLNHFKLAENYFKYFFLFYLSCLYLFLLPNFKKIFDLIVFTIILFVLVIINYLIPTGLNFIFILLSIILSSIFIKNKYSLIISITLFVIIFSGAILNLAIVDRFLLMVNWIFYFFYLFIFYFAFKIFSNYKYIIKNVTLSQFRSSIYYEINKDNKDNKIKSKNNIIIKSCLILFFLFFIISGIKLIKINIIKPTQIVNNINLNNEKIKKIMENINKIKNDAFDKYEIDNINKSTNQNLINNGEIFIQKFLVSKYIYNAPENKKFSTPYKIFNEQRNYSRSICRYSSYLNYSVSPFVIPKDFFNKYVIGIGRFNEDIADPYIFPIETIAIIPFKDNSDILDYNNMLVSKNADHDRILQNLKIKLLNVIKKTR